MEEEYNWNLILKSAVPASLVEAYIFYTGISDGWKWASLAAALFLSGAVVYMKDRKRHNIFTAAGIVFLVALVVRFLKNAGFL